MTMLTVVVLDKLLRPLPSHNRPKPITPTGPNEIWWWDITWMPAAVKEHYSYLYMIMDIYSRKIVG